MNDLHIVANIPDWAAYLAAALVLFGASLTLLGTWGLVRMKRFYDRVHTPTLGATLGAGGILLAAILYFSILQGKPFLFPVLIAVFMTLTTPVTLIALVRAALYRDRTEGTKNIPRDD